MKKWICVFVSCVLLMGCDKFEQKRRGGLVAEYNGSTLAYSDLDILTRGLSLEDSARVAEQYIRQWATGLIVWEKSKDLGDKEIDRLVEDYRRWLYQFEWEKRQVSQKMPTYIEDTVVYDFYERNKSHFVLEESIVRGVLLVMPAGAPNIDKLREVIKKPYDEEQIEWVEKYAYQYASGYELFLDDWKTASQIALYLPTTKEELSKQLKQKKQIEWCDSLNIYLLQVTDVCSAGEYEPLEYVQDKIQEMILSERQVEFVQSLRDDLYEKAIENGKLKRYEK